METEKERLTKMLERLSREHVKASSAKFPDIAKEHGFERVSSEENGAFVVRDLESQKYFRVLSNNEFKEIESP